MTTIRCANCNQVLTAQQAGEHCPNCGSTERNIPERELKVAKDKALMARELASRHFQVEPGLTHVVRYSSSADLELVPSEPVKFLEVNQNTVPSGILPLRFGPAPSSGIDFSSIIVEVTPEEYAKILNSELALPVGWSTSDELTNGHLKNGMN
ncbi:hypothetical protein BH10PLA2_BH10PLA2_28010 [soil metagenome]